MSSTPNNTEDNWETHLIEYSLGLMDPAAAMEFERGLDECRGHVTLAQQYTQVVGLLGQAVAPSEPPSGHKERFAAMLAATPQEGRPDAAVSAAPTLAALPTQLPRQLPPSAQAVARVEAPSNVTDLNAYRDRRSPRVLPVVASIAAALLLLVVGWGWWSTQQSLNDANNQVASLQSQVTQATQQATQVAQQRDTLLVTVKQLQVALGTITGTSVAFFMKGTDSSPSSWMMCILEPASNQASVVGGGFQPLSPDQVYELWWLPPSGNPVPAGTFSADASGNAQHQATAPQPLTSYTGVAVSIEQGGEKQTPSKNIVLAGNYQLNVH